MKNYIYSFLSNRALSRFSILLIDYLIILFIYIVNYGFGFASQEDSIGAMTLSLILIFFNTVFFIFFRTFSGVLRFSSFSDLIRIIYSLLFGYVLSYIAILVIKRFNDNLELNNLLFIAIFFLNMFLMVFSRILVKEIYEKITDGTVKPLNVFIYGTKQAGISVAKALKGNNEFNYRVRGFISDEQHMIGKQLIGVSIYPNDEILLRTLEANDVKTIIVSHQKMEEIKNSDLLANFVDNNISLLTTVPVNEWNGKVIKKAQIKDVQIEDLLPRDPINVNMMQIADNLEGKRVMVTGAAGSI